MSNNRKHCNRCGDRFDSHKMYSDGLCEECHEKQPTREQRENGKKTIQRMIDERRKANLRD
jgi:DNA-directed RNA polymerase subunit RPC12/RpoP